VNLLEVRDLHVGFGGAHVLQGVSFDVPAGGVTALLGRNGVGKTTTIRAVLGLVHREGTVLFEGVRIDAEPTHRIVRRGVGYVPEDRATERRATSSSTTSSPSSPSVVRSGPERSPAASSRCSRSGAPCSTRTAFC
jgi:branched-chain amino acid transport system ATP-binding protein